MRVNNIELEDFETRLAPLVKMYLRQVFEELQAFVTSRLSHQQIVDQYKVRCENYDWKEIKSLIDTHTLSKKMAGRKRFEYEDLLTLHFARYLHDNGYSYCFAQVEVRQIGVEIN